MPPLLCTMWFVRSQCKFSTFTERALKKHQREIHEPEALSRNGYDPGYVEPARIHCAQIGQNGIVTRYLENRGGFKIE